MKLLLVDLSGQFHPRWHAGAAKELSFARDWTLSRIRVVGERLGVDRVVVALEGHGPSWRKERSTDYKANREPPSAQLIEELRLTEESCGREGWHVLRRDGFEADDVIASLAAWADENDHNATILSDDKDFAQCLRDGSVEMLRSDDQVRTADDVARLFGVPVSAMIQWQALCGDSSDNVPGVKRVGGRTATKLLCEWGDIDGIVRAAANGEIKGALGTNICDADESKTLALSLALVTLRTDALTDEECAAVLEKLEPVCETADEFTNNEESWGDMSNKTEPETTTETHEEPQPDGTVVKTEVQTAEAEPPPAAPSEPELSPELEAVAEETAKRPEFSRSFEPRNMAEAKQLTQIVFDSRLFKAYGTKQAVLLVMMAGREFGWGAMTSLRNFDIVEGRPVLKSQSMMALCLRSDVCKQFRVLFSKCDAKRATVLVQRTDWDEPQEVTWTIEQAKQANLTRKANWQHHAAEMLINRCVAVAARFMFPDVVGNIHSADELGAEDLG